MTFLICSQICKVEKILKGSLDSISSPSVKIQIKGGKFTWGVKARYCWELSTNILYSKVCWQHPVLFCLYPAHNLNFHWRWRWWDRIQAIYLNLFYFTNLKFKSWLDSTIGCNTVSKPILGYLWSKKATTACQVESQIIEQMCLETHYQYENSVFGRFGQSGMQRRKKNPNFHMYGTFATFWGIFFTFWQKFCSYFFLNVVASTLKSYILISWEKYEKIFKNNWK